MTDFKDWVKILISGAAFLVSALSLWISFVSNERQGRAATYRSVLAFLAGACGGAFAVPRSASTSVPALRHSWRFPVACLALGPVLGIALFGIVELTDNILPVDRLYDLSVFLAVSSFAGLLSAAFVSMIVLRIDRRST